MRRTQSLAVPRNPWDDSRERTTHGQGNGGKSKVRETGAKVVGRHEKSSMDPLVIRDIKVAAAELETNASQVLETAAKEWLERYRAGKK